jgi:hypothetical protein
MTRALPALLLVTLVGCGNSTVEMEGEPDTSVETDDTPPADSDTLVPPIADGTRVITPEYVRDVCEEIWGEDHHPHVGWPMPWQDEFCSGKEDCYVSDGPSAPLPCPNECICICFDEMAFGSTCTLVGCEEESICI